MSADEENRTDFLKIFLGRDGALRRPQSGQSGTERTSQRDVPTF
jgi:hypothetical protein